MADLIALTARLHESWLRSGDDWGRGVHQDGAGLRPEDDVDSPDGFAAWVRRLLREAGPAVPLPQGLVHCTYWWIVEDDEVLGAIALRHELSTSPTSGRDRRLLERAVAHGELPADTDLDAAVDRLVGPVYYRVLVTGQPVTPDFVETLVRQVVP
jgi:hypothetical protein